MATGIANFISAVGNREDLADIISVVDGHNTPLTSSIKKGKKLTNMHTEWQVDSYDTPSTAGTVDGTAVTTSGQYTNASANRARVGTYGQYHRRAFGVTPLQQLVAQVAGINDPDPHGVAGKDEYNRAKAKEAVQQRRDIETTYLSDNGCQLDNGTVPYLTRGLGKSLSTTADSVLPQPTSQLLPTAQVYDINVNSAQTMAAFTEDSFRAILASRWGNCGNAKVLMGIVGTAVKDAITDFTRYETNKSGSAAVRFYGAQPVEEKKVSTTVDVYEGDYGTVELHLSKFVPNPQRGYIIDPDYVEIRPLLAGSYMDLPNTGSGPNGLIETIAALCVLNSLAHCKIAGA